MHGSPTRTAKGLNFSCVLNPAIIAGFAVQITSKFYTGLVRAAVVEHMGSKRGLQWLTKAQCEVIK